VRAQHLDQERTKGKSVVDESPIVTVIINTFNHEDYILQCLQSVMKQNFEGRLEILVIDDASTDRTYEILRENSINVPHHIRIVRLNENEHSKGLWPGLAQIKDTKAEFLAFCDGDDFWIDQNKLTKQISKIRSSTNIGIVHTDYYSLEQIESKWIQKERSEKEISKARQTLSSLDLIEGNNVKSSTALIRKSAIDFTFVENAKTIPAKDWLLFLTVGINHKIVFLDEKTTVHRISEKGIWNGLEREVKSQIKEAIAWYCAASFPNIEIRNLFRKRVSYIYCRNLLAESMIGSYVKRILRTKRFLLALILKNDK